MMNNKNKPDKVQVHLVTYDSSRDESPARFEQVMSVIASDPDRYEIISMDKTITQAGVYVCAVLYKEMPEPYEEEFEVTIPDELDDIKDLKPDADLKPKSRAKSQKQISDLEGI